jgi:2-polyprenyl-3-methyl-5-hydroxy-6-metoxy-1,4-benzoquinol methylase
MTSVDAGERYDSYWKGRDVERTRARSRSRAVVATDLLDRLASRRSVADVGDRLLEVGCGPGWALEVFRDSGFTVEGIDVSEEAVRRARKSGLEASVLNFEREDLGRDGFDIVVAMEVIEHLYDPLAAIDKLLQALKPGGFLVISLPNEIHLSRRFSILFGEMDFGGHDDPHVYHFNDRSARRLFDAANLRVLDHAGDSIVPPRNPTMRSVCAPLVRTLPGLFAIANVYLLETRSRGGDS